MIDSQLLSYKFAIALWEIQDLRKLAFEAPLVGAHRRAPSLYVEFLRKS
jgi:hypothetical protein